jgi:two-component system OmpR family sensor kinase
VTRLRTLSERLGLRARLTIALGLIVAVALAATFVVTYRGTGAEVRGEIDQDLRQDTAAFIRDGIPASATKPAQVEAEVRAYLARQPSFGASARLFLARVAGGATISNEPELLGISNDPLTELETSATQERERTAAAGVRTAPPGFHTVDLVDAGDVRLLVKRVIRGGRVVADVGVGESLDAVRRAQHGVSRTFLLAGLLALLASLVAGYALASGVSRPLRRMARTAADVDAGDLSHRMAINGSPREVRVLADSFDHMLDRLEDAFARQRGFVADASHELRTPLTAIRGQLEVMARQDQPTAEDVERVGRLVRTETERMERLVEDLLLLARSDEGHLVRPEEIDVEPFLLELFHALVPTADRHFELGPLPHGTILADPDRTAQVIRNLARNAIAHTRPGGLVRIVAKAHGDRLQIAVEDDGPGIPEAEWELVFDRFHRADRARARSAGGAGLGLAIAKAIVEAHGGSIRVERAPAGGARVIFELPGFVPYA